MERDNETPIKAGRGRLKGPDRLKASCSRIHCTDEAVSHE